MLSVFRYEEPDAIASGEPVPRSQGADLGALLSADYTEFRQRYTGTRPIALLVFKLHCTIRQSCANLCAPLMLTDCCCSCRGSLIEEAGALPTSSGVDTAVLVRLYLHLHLDAWQEPTLKLRGVMLSHLLSY